MLTWVEVGPEQWQVIASIPDQIDEFGRRLHLVTGRDLWEHEGLDRAIVASGLVMHNTIPWGNDGGEVWFAEVGKPTGVDRQR